MRCIKVYWVPDHVDTARITRLIGSRGWALKLACLLASLPWQRAIRGLSVLFLSLLVSICSEAIEVSVSINSVGEQRAAGSSTTTLGWPFQPPPRSTRALHLQKAQLRLLCPLLNLPLERQARVISSACQWPYSQKLRIFWTVDVTLGNNPIVCLCGRERGPIVKLQAFPGLFQCSRKVEADK